MRYCCDSQGVYMYLGLDMSLSHQGQCFQELACPSGRHYIVVIIVHSLNHVQLFTHPWTAARLLCPPLSQWSNSCPLSQWCYLSISSSAAPFSSCPLPCQASESFPMSQLFASSANTLELPVLQSFSFSISPSSEYSRLISFRIDWFDLLAVQGTLQESYPALLANSKTSYNALWKFSGIPVPCCFRI